MLELPGLTLGGIMNFNLSSIEIPTPMALAIVVLLVYVFAILRRRNRNKLTGMQRDLAQARTATHRRLHVLAVEDSAEVMEDHCVVLPTDRLGSGLEHVVHRYDLAAVGHRLQELLPSSPDPYEAKMYPVVGSGAAGLAEDLGGDEEGNGEGRCPFDEELAAGKGGPSDHPGYVRRRRRDGRKAFARLRQAKVISESVGHLG